MQWLAVLNVAEGFFWIATAVVVAVRSAGAPPPLRRLGRFVAVVFVAFAGTDFVEAQTGAWYRPWWLLAYNTVCVALLAGCLWKYLGWRRSLAAPNPGDPESEPLPK